MSASVTLTQLIGSVRRRAGIEFQVGFITDAELTDLINEEGASLYDRLVQAGGQPFFRKSVAVPLTSGVDTYSLTSLIPDFFRLQSIDIQVASGQWLSAVPYMEHERNIFKGSFPVAIIGGSPLYYRLQGSNLTFIPTPSGSYTSQVNYSPTYTKLVSGSDSFDGINGWEALIVWRVVASCKAKADMDPSYAMAKAAELERRIDALAEQRDANHAERVRDVYAEQQWPWGLR